MIRISLSILTITVLSALYSASSLKAVESINFDLPGRATRQAITNDNLLNTSRIGSLSQPSRFNDLRTINLQRIERLQNLLDLERRVNAKAIESSA